MAATQIYEPQDQSPGLTPLPEGQAPTEGYQAMEAAAGEGDRLAYRLAWARDQTVETQAQTKLLQAHSSLQNQYIADPNFNNFKTAPGEFAADWTSASNSILGDANKELSAPAQARLAHTAAMLQITGSNAVNQAALSREGQTNVAEWQTQAPLLQQGYLNAGSDAERAMYQKQGLDRISAMGQAGWIGPEAAAKESQGFSQGLEEARVAKIMQTDPTTAKAMLADPGQLTAIPPDRRIALQNNAASAVDEQGSLKLGVLAKTSPPAAAAAIGRIAPTDTATVAGIFDKGVIPQESGGQANAVSPAGALGVAQVMPDTARAAATRMGLTDVAALNDDDLKTRLLADPTLNRQLGLSEFSRLVQHYNGYIPAALAAYNAGQGNAQTPRADAWLTAAQAKFGDTPTPAQFASVIPIKESQDYIGKVYAHLGAPTDAYGLTGNAALRAQETVLDVGQQEQSRQQRTLNAGAALARADDPVAQILQDGYSVDPGRVAAYRQSQTLAAAGGNPEASAELRRLDMAEAQAPIMKAAYQMPPSALAATIAAEQQRMSNAPDVSSFEVARLKTLQTVQSAMDAAKTTNTIGLAERQGMFRATPVMASDIGTPAFGDALAARNGQTLAAANAYDGNIVPLKPEEASALKTAWGQMGPADKANLAATMATNLKDPRVYEAAMRQVAGDNRLELTAGILGGQDPQLGQKILAGQELLKDKGVESKVGPLRTAITAALPVGLYPNTQTNSDVAEAVAAVYAADKGATHALIDPTDATGIKSAIEEVTGPLTTINGRATPIPKDFAPGAVQHGLANLSADDLKPFGGLQPGVDPGWLGAHAQLMPLKLGGSSYQVLVNGQRVLTADGRNLQVDLGQFAAQQKARLDAAANQRGLDVNADRSNPLGGGYGGGL